jgi:hypothetical protein
MSKQDQQSTGKAPQRPNVPPPNTPPPANDTVNRGLGSKNHKASAARERD